MDSLDLKKYLEQVVNLEGSIYRQERIYEKAQRELRPYVPTKSEISAPKMPEKIQPPNITRPVYEDFEIWKLILSIVVGILGVVCVALVPWLGVLVIIMSIGGIAMWKFEYDITKARYDKKMVEYTRVMADYQKAKQAEEKIYDKAMEEYACAMKKYETDVEKANKDYKRESQIAKQNYQKAKDAVNQIGAGLQDTKSILTKLYAMDVVFPKYRNLVAMCTIYEYVISGRCTKLEGPNGAYNLYEAELRQNLIINQLDTINRNLEAIKANQYMLYQEMTKLNQTLNKISSDIAEIRITTQKIKDFSAITAHCASITAANTEALKYLTLVK